MNNFWNRTNDLLKQQGNTQLELCTTCEINHQTFRGWIVHGTYPNALQVVKIAKFLNTSVEYLVTGIEPDTSKLELEQLKAKLRELCN